MGKSRFIRLVIVLMIQSCHQFTPSPPDIAGTWRSNDSAEIILKRDGNFSVTGLNAKAIDNITQNEINPVQKFNGKGTWKLTVKTGNAHTYEVQLFFHEIIPSTNIGGLTMLLSGAGILENDPPFKKIFLYVGDPDEEKRYEFIRQ